MRKSILLVISIVVCSNVGIGQFILGRSEYWGKAIGLNPHGIYERPVHWQFYLFEYRWPRLSIVSEILPAQISEVEYNNNKVDRTAFLMIGLGIRAPLHTISNAKDRLRLVYELSGVYKKIWEDVFTEQYSLNLQSGNRIGSSYKILLEYDTKELFLMNLGVSYYLDWFAFGVRDRSNAYLWDYTGVYFSIKMNMSYFVQALKERYKGKRG